MSTNPENDIFSYVKIQLKRDERKRPNEYYYLLSDIFDECRDGAMSIERVNYHMKTINKFFVDFCCQWLDVIIDKLSLEEPLGEGEKTGLKCLQLSISIIDEMTKNDEAQHTKYKKSRMLNEFMFYCLNGFKWYSPSSKEARIVTETILICLCNYYYRCFYGNTNNPQKRIHFLTKRQQDCVAECFNNPDSSQKIKLAAAVLIRLCENRYDKEVIGDSRAYLRYIADQKCEEEEYLGIDTRMVRILSESGETYERKVDANETKELTDLRTELKFKDERIGRLNEELKDKDERIEKLIKEIERIIKERGSTVRVDRTETKELRELKFKDETIEKLNAKIEKIMKEQESKNKEYSTIIAKKNEELKDKNEKIEKLIEEKNKEIESRVKDPETSSINLVSSGDAVILERTRSDRIYLFNERYSRLKKIFDNCHQIFKEVFDYFDFYNREIRLNILRKMANSESFEEMEKIGMNCLCVCISIINLNMDGMRKVIPYEQLFDYLNDFHQYSPKSAVARRMTEAILYCFCNYCDNINKYSDKQIALTNTNRECLKNCFTDLRSSNKMKLAAAVIISIFRSRDDQLGDDTRDYLKTVKDKCGEKYLGIDKQLISAAIDPEKEELQKLLDENNRKKKNIENINNIITNELQENIMTFLVNVIKEIKEKIGELEEQGNNSALGINNEKMLG